MPRPGRAPDIAAETRRPGARGLGGPDDRRVVWRAHRIQVQRQDHRGGPAAWRPEQVSNAIDQDDLYVEMTFAEVMDRLGLDATTEQYGEAFRHVEVQPLARQRRRAPAARDRHQGAVVGPSEVQRPRQRHRLPDRGRLHRPDGAGTAQRRARLQHPGGQVMNFGDGLYGGMFVTGMYAAAFFERDVRRVVESGLAMPPAARTRRSSATCSRGTARTPTTGAARGSGFRTSGTPRIRAPTGRCARSTSTRGSTALTSRWGLLYGNGDFARTLDDHDARGPGFRLQPLQRRRDSGRDARLLEDSRRVEVRDSGAGRPQVRLHELLVRRHRRLDAQDARSRWCASREGR